MIYHFDDLSAKGFKIDPAQAIEKMNKDLALMIEAEKGCKLCAKNSHLQVAPYEHCPDCGTRTGGGRCVTCKELIQSESTEK